MATLVPMKTGVGPVLVRLTISGIVQWHYAYVSRDRTFSGPGTSVTPITFEIGDPDRLLNESDSWNIAGANNSASDVPYFAMIEWLQAGVVIATWRDPSTGTKTVKSGAPVISDGDAFLAIL